MPQTHQTPNTQKTLSDTYLDHLDNYTERILLGMTWSPHIEATISHLSVFALIALLTTFCILAFPFFILGSIRKHLNDKVIQ